MLVQNFVERLRPLVGVKSWDYIVFWKLSDDHRYLELMRFICAGSQSVQVNGGELDFPASSARSCRDLFVSHPRIKPCDLLDHVPSSMTLDSGLHAEVLLSNQPCWFNFVYNSDSNASEETMGTRVLVPTPLGLLELFVTKQVPEDQGLIDFIKSQCNVYLQQHAMNNSVSEDSRFIVNGNGIHEIPSNLFPSDADIQLQISPKNSKFSHNKSIEGIHLDSSPFNSLEKYGSSSRLSNWVESSRSVEDCKNDKICFVEENNKSDDSDPNDDEENEVKYRKRTGKGHQSKNLEAERKRRKKLNDRLYRLRALVPKISKLDRSAILGDAIDYVKELQKQASDLQLELEEHSDDDNVRTKERKDTKKCMALHRNGTKPGNETSQNIFQKGCCGNGGIVNNFGQKSEVEIMNDKVQQMEPQVEVLQLDGNEFFIKVFCEHKPGGFLRLMEAFNYLGLEVRNVNATRHTCLVSNIFKVEIRENESVGADYVKESLLELTRNPLTECSSLCRNKCIHF